MNKQINKTRNKVLFNNLVCESKNYVKVRRYYKNGMVFKVYPINNTIINKWLVKI